MVTIHSFESGSDMQAGLTTGSNKGSRQTRFAFLSTTCHRMHTCLDRAPATQQQTHSNSHRGTSNLGPHRGTSSPGQSSAPMNHPISLPFAASGMVPGSSPDCSGAVATDGAGAHTLFDSCTAAHTPPDSCTAAHALSDSCPAAYASFKSCTAAYAPSYRCTAQERHNWEWHQ